MNLFIKIIRVSWISMAACVETFLASLPNTGPFSKIRVWYWRNKGYSISKTCFIARNVYFQGRVSIGDGSHIANNCLFNGNKAEIIIGEKVMVAPNCVLVAFDHGYHNLELPMVDQPCEAAPIIVEDDVWISANCTITKGVRLGRGCIVSANSMVRVDVPPYAAVRGVPAKVIGSRRMFIDEKKHNEGR